MGAQLIKFQIRFNPEATSLFEMFDMEKVNHRNILHEVVKAIKKFENYAQVLSHGLQLREQGQLSEEEFGVYFYAIGIFNGKMASEKEQALKESGVIDLIKDVMSTDSPDGFMDND